MTDQLSETYGELLKGTYNSLDRIVLNAYFRFAQSPAGFRIWWRQLHGTDDNLDNAHLIRLAGRFRRRLRAWRGQTRSQLERAMQASTNLKSLTSTGPQPTCAKASS
jgi:hypothetical protein